MMSLLPDPDRIDVRRFGAVDTVFTCAPLDLDAEGDVASAGAAILRSKT